MMTENTDNLKNSHIFRMHVFYFKDANKERTGPYLLSIRKGSSLHKNTSSGNCW